MSNNLGKEGRKGSLFHFEIYDRAYLYGCNSLNVYKVKNREKELVSRYFNSHSSLTHNHEHLIEYNTVSSEIDQISKHEHINTNCSAIIDDIEKSNVTFTELHNIKQLTLVVTQTCNLSCNYCYFADSLKEDKYMDIKTAKKAIEFLFEHSSNQVSLAFFGVEPLLAFTMIKSCTEFANIIETNENRNISFSIITNGTIANREIIRFLSKYNFDVGISLDGPDMIHDSLRISLNGEGSHSRVIANVNEYFSKVSDSINIRFHTLIHNKHYKYVRRLYKYFKDLENDTGITFGLFCRIRYLKDSKDFQEHCYFNLYKDMLCEYADMLINECLESNSLAPIYDSNRIDTGYLEKLDNKGPNSMIGCSSGIQSFEVYPDGTISGCRQLDPFNYPNSAFGNINELGAINDDCRTEPSIKTDEANECCANCWMVNICGGSCYAENIYNGNMRIPDTISCEYKQTLFKVSVYIKDRLSESGLWKTKKSYYTQ